MIENALPLAVATAVWQLANGALAENPQRVGTRLGRDLAGYWSAHRGQYRVIYAIDEETATVTILTVSHCRRPTQAMVIRKDGAIAFLKIYPHGRFPTKPSSRDR